MRYAITPDLPAGLSFDSDTRTLSGTTTATQPSTRYAYTVTDANSQSAMLNLNLAVIEPNQPGFDGSIFRIDETFAVGVPVALTLPVATGGTPPLIYSLGTTLGAPAMIPGLIFDADSRTLSGTPGMTQPSTQYTYVVRSSRGGVDQVLVFITITEPIQPDRMPTFGATIAPQTYFTSTAVNVTLPAASGGNGALTYAITETLPGGLTFTAATRVLNGTPTTVQSVMTYTYTATDSDDGVITTDSNPDSVELPFTITITPPPSVTGGGNTVTTTTSGATDAMGTLAITNLPDGVTPNWRTADRGTYGTLTLNAATGAWTYALDNTRAVTQALGPTAAQVETFTATTTIAGVPLTATITINLNAGVFPDDPPEVVFAGGPRMIVDEGEEMVTLDAGLSYDPENRDDGTTGLTFAWAHTAVDNVSPPPDEDLITPTNANTATATFTAPEERTRLTFTVTVTDRTGEEDTATLTVQVGRSSERALQKTLAAFGGAFAAGTVSVFEDYLSTPAGRANTSHFTIGGHKFELATTTPAQTLDSRVASVRKPLTRQRTLTLENDHSVVNTLSVSYPQKHKSPSVSFPNDRKTGSDSDHVFHRIGNPVEHDSANTTTMSAKDLLMKSAFHFNFKGDDPTATSGWSLWARATTTNFDGKPEDDFEQDGDVTSAYLGMDYQTPTGTRLGLAISETSGDVDYDDATDEAQGDLDADLTSILPYIQWQANDTTTAWAMLGYGEGDAELSTDGEAETTEVDIDMQMIALGISGDLTTYKRSEWSWKASAFAVELESEADEATDLPAVTADSQRLRAAIQGRIPGEASATGTQFTPNWELGLRWDDGDAEQGGGADVGLGFDYTNPVNGLSVQGKTSFLVAHEAEDYEEWEASLQARLDSGVQGRGVTFTLEPGWTADGRSQKMGMDFSNALGKWSKRGLRLELTGERTERDDNDIGHNIRLTGSLHF